MSVAVFNPATTAETNLVLPFQKIHPIDLLLTTKLSGESQNPCRISITLFFIPWGVLVSCSYTRGLGFERPSSGNRQKWSHCALLTSKSGSKPAARSGFCKVCCVL